MFLMSGRWPTPTQSVSFSVGKKSTGLAFQDLPPMVSSFMATVGQCGEERVKPMSATLASRMALLKGTIPAFNATLSTAIGIAVNLTAHPSIPAARMSSSAVICPLEADGEVAGVNPRGLVPALPHRAPVQDAQVSELDGTSYADLRIDPQVICLELNFL